MKLYNELADWWPVLSAPEEYEEEAGLFWKVISKYKPDARTLLEFGSGGGNNAFHLKHHLEVTLSDLSPSMIAVSEKLNPECRHFEADMRAIDLEETFDVVFIHDAIMLITNERDLAYVFERAAAHLRPGGLLLVVPDFFKETFKPSTDHGGHDVEGRSLRYLEWTYDDDESDTIVSTQYAYLIKEENGMIRQVNDWAIEGIFPRKTWEELLIQQGFSVSFEEIPHSELPPGQYIGIAAVKNIE